MSPNMFKKDSTPFLPQVVLESTQRPEKGMFRRRIVSAKHANPADIVDRVIAGCTEFATANSINRGDLLGKFTRMIDEEHPGDNAIEGETSKGRVTRPYRVLWLKRMRLQLGHSHGII